MKLPSFPFLSMIRRKGPVRPSRKNIGILGYIAAGAVLLAIIGIAAAIVFITGLPGYRSGITAVVLTNIPETAAYVDMFNASQDGYRILLSYTPTPVRELAGGNIQADIVIGKDIGYDEAFGLFQPLDYLFHEGGFFQAAFYQGALSLGAKDGKQLLLPVSFDLPTLMFDDSDSASLPSLAISVEKIREIAGGFNTVTKGVYTAMGFSPLWYGEFLPVIGTLFGASFHETQGRDIAWDEKAVETAMKFVREWIRVTNGGFETDTMFREKYLYDPGYRLIRNSRIRFAVTSGSEFFLMPEENRESLDFRWIERNDRIAVSDTLTFLGIPKRAKHKAAAEAFIRWFFQTDTQKRLIETAKLKQVKTFGIAGGFSSLIQVNEVILPQVYPLLLSHIPSQNYFLFPQRLPQQWAQMKQDVIIPWLKTAVASGDDSFSEETLRKAVKAWRLSEGEY